jgi:SAM-dependent methyltransferase
MARHLSNRGLDASGVDLSPAMVATAQRLNPELRFVQSDMLQLPFEDGWFAGIIAFYSLIHIERALLPCALAELYRVLALEGRLLVAFHAGEGEIHREEWYGQTVAVHVTMFTSAEMTKTMENAGFRIGEVIERDPYEFEYPSRRAFITVSGKINWGRREFSTNGSCRLRRRSKVCDILRTVNPLLRSIVRYDIQRSRSSHRRPHRRFSIA